MYGIGGEKDLTEHTLDHLTGYRDSRPVRVGNGAWDQHQNDVWGMILDAVDTYIRQGAAQIVNQTWEGIADLVDEAIKHAGDPDQGIWEIRGDPQYFTASKVLCWVAMDRGSDLAQARQDQERAVRWRQAADDLKAEILDKGVDERGRFRQQYGNAELDASLLLIPIMEFLPADRRAGAHHRAGHRRRTHRRRPGAALQGGHHRHRVRRQGGHVHHLLVLAGDRPGHDRRGGAGLALCKKLLSFAGPLQLYAEEIDTTTGEHLGNFPQAFTHLALIDAVGRLIELEQAGGIAD